MRCDSRKQKVNRKIQGVFNTLKNPIYKMKLGDAIKYAQEKNKELFFGEEFIKIVSDNSGKIQSVHYNKRILDEVIEQQMDLDDKTLSKKENNTDLSSAEDFLKDYTPNYGSVASNDEFADDFENFDEFTDEFDEVPPQIEDFDDNFVPPPMAEFGESFGNMEDIINESWEEFDDSSFNPEENGEEYKFRTAIKSRLKVKKKIEQKIRLLENSSKTRESRIRIQKYRQILSNIMSNLTYLNGTVNEFKHYVDKTSDDIENIKELLKKPDEEAFELVEVYLEAVKNMTRSDNEGFLHYSLPVIQETLKDLENTNKDSVLYENLKVTVSKLEDINREVGLIESLYETSKKDRLLVLIEKHVKNSEELGGKFLLDKEIRKIAKRLYDMQMSPSYASHLTGKQLKEQEKRIKASYENLLKEKEELKEDIKEDRLTDLEKELREKKIKELEEDFRKSQKKAGLIRKVDGALSSRVRKMEDQEENGDVIMSAMYKILSDAVSKRPITKVEESLKNLKEPVHKRLIELGFYVGKGIFKEASMQPFLREDSGANQLIRKFSKKWDSYLAYNEGMNSTITSLINLEGRTELQDKAIDNHFKDVLKRADFLDITSVPELIEDTETFGKYSNTFVPLAEAQEYKTKLIEKVGEKEYNRFVEDIKQKIYSYEAFVNMRESKIRGEYNIPPQTLINKNSSHKEGYEKSYNAYITATYSKDPFIFAQNFKKYGDNKIEKKFQKNGVEYTSRNTIADTEHLVLIPKRESDFDKNFDVIENDTLLKEAWGHMFELVEFTNENGFNSDPTKHNRNAISSAKKDFDWLDWKHLKKAPLEYFTMLVPGTLRKLHKNLSSDRLRNKDKSVEEGTLQVAGATVTDDQLIEQAASFEFKQLVDGTPEDYKRILSEEKQKVLNKKSQDLIENILTASELASTFKARKESEAKCNFLLKQLKDNPHRKMSAEVAEFFVDKQLYGINNRENFVGTDISDSNFSDGKYSRWTRFYNDQELLLKDSGNRALVKLKEELKNPKRTDKEKKEIQKEIDSIDIFFETAGRVITSGSILAGTFQKVRTFSGMAANVGAQITNMDQGTLNALEVQGKQGFYDMGVYDKATRFARKSPHTIANKARRESFKIEQEIGEAVLLRYGLFQNSANEIFKMEEKRFQKGLVSILQDPMNLVKESEKRIQKPQIYALMSKVMIESHIEGVEGVPMFDANAKFDPKTGRTNFFPAFDIVEGQLALKPEFSSDNNVETFINKNTQEYANIFGNAGRIPKKIAYINGDYRDLSSYMYEKEFIPATMMMFKRWMIMAVEKKYGAFNSMSHNANAAVATDLLAMKATAYTVSTGIKASLVASLGGPIIMVAAPILYATINGPRKTKEELKGFIAVSKGLIQGLSKHTKSGASFLPPLLLATTMQSFNQVTRMIPFIGRPLVSESWIKSIIKINEIDEQGIPLSAEQKTLVMDSAYFLMTSISKTIALSAFRLLLANTMFPDDEEEEEYKASVERGDIFYQRFWQDPDTTLYYLAENILTGMQIDSNLMVNIEGMARNTAFQAKDFVFELSSAAYLQMTQGDITKGKNAGRNRLWTKFTDHITATFLKDGVSLGLGSKSQKDYDKRDIFQKDPTSDLGKIKKVAPKLRKEFREEIIRDYGYKDMIEFKRELLEEEKRGDKKGFATEVEKIMKKEVDRFYPKVMKEDFDSEGDIKSGLKYKRYVTYLDEYD